MSSLRVAGWALVAGLCVVAGCNVFGPPPMEPLTEEALEAAEGRWEAHGTDSYHLVVRVRAPKFETAVYDVRVAGGRVVAVARNDQKVPRDDFEEYDYSVQALFELLHEDLRLGGAQTVGNVRPIDLRVRFDETTGRLVRYRRTVGTSRRRVLMIEVLAYEPEAVVASPDTARRIGPPRIGLREGVRGTDHPSSGRQDRPLTKGNAPQGCRPTSRFGIA